LPDFTIAARAVDTNSGLAYLQSLSRAKSEKASDMGVMAGISAALLLRETAADSHRR